MKKTFAELLVYATPGPFTLADSAITARVMHPTGATLAIKYLCKFPPEEATAEEQRANAELITRLLSFAHAGGPSALERMIVACGWVKSCGGADVSADMEAASKALAILNAQSQP